LQALLTQCRQIATIVHPMLIKKRNYVSDTLKCLYEFNMSLEI
jgi:hypothetical protein